MRLESGGSGAAYIALWLPPGCACRRQRAAWEGNGRSGLARAGAAVELLERVFSVSSDDNVVMSGKCGLRAGVL